MDSRFSTVGHESRNGAPAAPGPRLWAWVVVLASMGAVGLALISQYQFGMQPCPWCTFQRLLFVAISFMALVCALRPFGWAGAGAAVLAVLLGLAGMASALWQHFVAAKSGSCAMTLADRILDGLGLFALLPSVFEPKASCAEAAVDLLGWPYEFWSLALFGICAGSMTYFLWCLRSARAR